MITRENHYF